MEAIPTKPRVTAPSEHVAKSPSDNVKSPEIAIFTRSTTVKDASPSPSQREAGRDEDTKEPLPKEKPVDAPTVAEHTRTEMDDSAVSVNEKPAARTASPSVSNLGTETKDSAASVKDKAEVIKAPSGEHTRTETMNIVSAAKEHPSTIVAAPRVSTVPSSPATILTANEPSLTAAKPVFKPRTSSLQQTAPPAQPAHSASPEQTSWAGFVKSRAHIFSFVANLGRDYDSDEDDGSWEDVSYPGANSPSRRIGHNSESVLAGGSEPLLSDLDPKSVEFLLTRLNIENQALTLNPKTIYVQDGNVRGYQPTLYGLTNNYSTKAPGEEDPSDVDFWNSIIEDYGTIAHKIPHLLTARVRAGIPPHLRAKIWTVMSGAQEDRIKAVYPLLQKEESPYERIIRRDIPRTYPKLEMFKEEGGEGQEKLYRLLKAYSIYDAEVGYCQGLSFVVGPLLLQDMSETEAFAVLVRLLEDNPPPPKANSTGPHHPHRAYALRTLFEPEMSGLHKLLYQHTELVRAHLPALHAHFQDCGITATMYASQWFLTLYTYNFFPLPFVFRIFDIIFAEGAIETMLRFSIAILKRNQSRLLEQDEFEHVLDLLKGDRLYEGYQDDSEAIVRDAVDVYDLVSDSTLQALSEKYAEDQKKRAKLVSETELVGLQALIKQLRVETSRSEQIITNLTQDNEELQKKLTETQRELHAQTTEREALAARVVELERASAMPAPAAVREPISA
ncbi:hypothetical protein PhCBS80983_g01247 [Powellomyces hirtus]|uniref:Rab-GAP TBC domain-containing protein n=1 Tax=Powellomyces hirtus TaxID=109895 RepID=A0A507EAW7_9FUNG|nr:hypothetical protein PhCBS80983_g01247 [Powellomyces hirtus]